MTEENIIYTPLSFWFCRSPSMHIPLISMQYPIRLNITFNSLDDIIINQEPDPPPESIIESPPKQDFALPSPFRGISITANFPNPEFQLENLREIMKRGRHPDIIKMMLSSLSLNTYRIRDLSIEDIN